MPNILIGGLLKYSLTDWPGRVAAVVFTQGCNFRCPWCHNPDLVLPSLFGRPVEEEEVLAFLRSRHLILDGVVVSGGEPTLQEGLPAFLEKVRSLGLLVKLYTNGSRPSDLRMLLKEGLVQAVAIDYKLLLGDYPRFTKGSCDGVLESLSLLNCYPGEVRTTVVSGIHTAAYLIAMEEELGGILDLDRTREVPWVRQPFRRPKGGVIADYVDSVWGPTLPRTAFCSS